MQKILKTYLRRLINLSSANRSLLLMNLPKSQFLDLHDLDFVLNQPSFEMISQLVSGKKQIPLCEVTDPRDVRNNEISKQMAQIRRTCETIEEERGVQDLFVGYPFIKGKFMDGTPVRCPLLFFPVTLRKGQLKGASVQQWYLEPREAGVTLNRSFLTAYAHFNHQRLAEELFDFTLEDFPQQILEFRTALYEFLKESPLNVNFNQDLFTDKLTGFERMVKADLEEQEKNGVMKLYPQAVLGIFPQGGSFLIEDYEIMLKNRNFEEEDGFETLFPAPEVFASGNTIREEDILLPFEVDASQEEAIRAVKTGQSLLVQGPPGTGKSQLICNLISDYIAEGKKVLVVCQKRAALDTVYKRLEKAGITDFVSLVHDYKNDRKAIFEKLSAQIDRTDTYKKQNQSLDAIFLEREFDRACRRIDQLAKELNHFKTALFDESYCGRSIKELYLLRDPQAELTDLGMLYRDFNFMALADFERDLDRVYAYRNVLEDGSEGADFWRKRKSFRHRTLSDLKRIITLLVASAQTWERISAETHSLLAKPLDAQELTTLIPEVLDEVTAMLSSEQALQFFALFDEGKIEPAEQTEQDEMADSLHQIITGKGISSVFLEYPDRYGEALDEALSKSGSFIGKSMFRLFSGHKDLLTALLASEGLQYTTTDLTLLKEKYRNTQLFRAVWEKAAAAGVDLPQDPGKALVLWKDYRKAAEAFDVLKGTMPVLSHTAFTSQTTPEAFFQLSSVLKAGVLEMQSVIESLKEYLTAAQVDLFWTADTKHLLQYLERSFDYLTEYDQLTGSFTTNESKVLELLDAAGIDKDPAEAFRQSLIQAWIAHIEELHPGLRGASTLKMPQYEEELQTVVRQKQELSRDILAMKIREYTYRDIEKNRLGNATTYRELYHQTTKKRKIWPLRKLLSEFSEEIFRLIPCWLVSPETTSAIFPMPGEENDYGKFDLVIFDEASQCFSEAGIPALMRARQAVIVGDNKQLQPSDLYRIRYEEQDTEEVLLEIDSLLDLGAQFLPQKQLTGHYRSRSLELIDFSNRHFYGGRLRLLPHFHDINTETAPVKFVKVEGLWEDNTNPVEALAVVELIRVLRTENPEEEIGVVAFNFKQAELIYRLLESEGPDMKGVHVKNIENIQGDEFQTLIFSIAYAPDKSGRIMMNFGSLNQKGGENRLNVAVTRAKERVFVVSSIFPEQLLVEQSSNEGPRLLKKYLEYVRAVSAGGFIPASRPSEKSFAVSLRHLLLHEQPEQSGLRYAEELPFADITVKEGDKYHSLLLTDDTLFYDSLSAKDFFAYLPLLLKQKGWNFERRWSRLFRNGQ